jgi:hypothetical protein
MQFKILGANSETGDDVDLVLEAASHSEVEQLAHNKGILVSSIAPLPSTSQAVAVATATRTPVSSIPAGKSPPPTSSIPAGKISPTAPSIPAGKMSPAAPSIPAGKMSPGAPAIPAGKAPPATGAPPEPPAHALHREKDFSSISLVDDDAPAEGSDPAAPPHERAHGLITVNANAPSEAAHTGAGTIDQGKHAEAPMEYHIILNQSLFLLESAVNRHLHDGWEPQGGLSVGISNNAMQFFQAMIRKKKPSSAPASAVPATPPTTAAPAAPKA